MIVQRGSRVWVGTRSAAISVCRRRRRCGSGIIHQHTRIMTQSHRRSALGAVDVARNGSRRKVLNLRTASKSKELFRRSPHTISNNARRDALGGRSTRAGLIRHHSIQTSDFLACKGPTCQYPVLERHFRRCWPELPNLVVGQCWRSRPSRAVRHSDSIATMPSSGERDPSCHAEDNDLTSGSRCKS